MHTKPTRLHPRNQQVRKDLPFDPRRVTSLLRGQITQVACTAVWNWQKESGPPIKFLKTSLFLTNPKWYYGAPVSGYKNRRICQAGGSMNILIPPKPFPGSTTGSFG